MRITIVSSTFIPLPPAGCGAVERVWDGLAREFARRGHKVTFICRNHVSQQADEIIDNVHFIRRTNFNQTRWRTVNLAKGFAYAARIIPLLPKSDILVINDVCTALTILRFPVSRGKIVLNLQRIPKLFSGRLLFPPADSLVAASGAVREVVSKLFPNLLTKLQVIGNPIYTDIFKTPVQTRTVRNKKRLLYTGRIHPEKR